MHRLPPPGLRSDTQRRAFIFSLLQRGRKSGQRLQNAVTDFAVLNLFHVFLTPPFPNFSHIPKTATLSASPRLLPAPPRPSPDLTSMNLDVGAQSGRTTCPWPQRIRVWAEAGTLVPSTARCVLRRPCLWPVPKHAWPLTLLSLHFLLQHPWGHALRAEGLLGLAGAVGVRPKPVLTELFVHPVPSPLPSGEQLWGDHSLPFWGRLSQVSGY